MGFFVGGSFVWLQQYPPYQHADRAGEGQNATRGLQHAPADKPPLIARSESSDSSHDTTSQDHKSPENEPNWLYRFLIDVKITDVLLVIFTALLAVYTGRLWYATAGLWVAAKEQSIDMKSSLDTAARSAAAMERVAAHIAISASAAQDSVAAVRERTAAQMRAYLSVIVGAAIYQERDKSIRFEAKPVVVNNGFTPARMVRCRAKAAILRPPIPADFDFRLEPKFIQGGNVIGSQNHNIISAIVDEYVPDEEISDIKSGRTSALHVWGLVEYEDIFGEQHKTEFCQCLTWLPNGTIHGWYLAQYNNTT